MRQREQGFFKRDLKGSKKVSKSNSLRLTFLGCYEKFWRKKDRKMWKNRLF